MNMQPTGAAAQTRQDFPSLSFQVNKDRCSITARCVSSIMLMPEQVVRFPEAPEYCKGLIHLRGQVIPLVDLRSLFGLPTLQQEYDAFCAMLDARKQDHINWVRELERCMQEDIPFGLSTDHHLCALGKWYDSFASDSTSVNFHLHKLDEPHQRFHAVAVVYNECNRDHENCKREHCLKLEVNAARDTYMPLILNLLEEAKQVFLSSYQAIVIVIEGQQGTLGLVVDQVHSVETVQPISQDKSSDFFAQSRFVSGVGQSDKSTQNLLILDEEALLSLCEGLQY